ncbi:tetratricopeptide repeat protein [Patescibacteria group bacterium]|nr:tetratricopeptide repeat protein [Patescibacteria group bacterium]MBU1682633.1 tetratricopeptide repeat protein [Patescibacteria group bacterium]MBU1934662.1 tetratricopeptide repeat protein [Patescibacteria group bacterium]
MNSPRTLSQSADTNNTYDPDTHEITTTIPMFHFGVGDLVCGRIELALQTFRQASKENPDNAILLLDISHALREADQLTEASKYYDKYLAIKQRERIEAVLAEYRKGE